MIIHIAVFEPGDTMYGGIEWRTDRAKAEEEFRAFRSDEGIVYLFTDVTVPAWFLTPEEITDWIDYLYWETGEAGMIEVFGKPEKVYDRRPVEDDDHEPGYSRIEEEHEYRFGSDRL